MKLSLLAIRRLPRALGAIMLIATLVLGAVGHLLHHLEDPHCGERREQGAASTTAARAATCMAARWPRATRPLRRPRSSAWSGFAAPDTRTPSAAAITGGAPRAPPAA